MMMKTLRAFGAGMIGAAAFAVMAVPATAQEQPVSEPGTIVDISLDGCDIVVTFTGGADGEHHIEVWDDGAQIGDVPVTTTTGTTAVGRYRITAVVEQGASGLGITLVGPGGGELDWVDPYNGADAVIDFCASQQPEPEPEPEPTPEPEPVSNIEPAVAPVAVAVVADPEYTG
jgi:hypothetical protein